MTFLRGVPKCDLHSVGRKLAISTQTLHGPNTPYTGNKTGENILSLDSMPNPPSGRSLGGTTFFVQVCVSGTDCQLRRATRAKSLVCAPLGCNEHCFGARQSRPPSETYVSLVHVIRRCVCWYVGVPRYAPSGLRPC